MMDTMMDTQEDEVLVWRKTTWGRFGQHNNLYTFVIDLADLQIQPIFNKITTRYENCDSSKNIHRYTYAKKDDILKLNNVILKKVHDYASSSNRDITITYYLVSNGSIVELEAERGLRDSNGFYDLIKLPDGRCLRCTKDKVEWV